MYHVFVNNPVLGNYTIVISLGQMPVKARDGDINFIEILY